MATNSLPKNEERCLTYHSENGKTYVITRHNLDGKFHLYEEKDDAYIHLRQRSSDPFFKETSPEHYAKGDIEYTR